MKDERHEFEIKIDCENYTLNAKEMTAAEILSLADKSPDAFHLVEMKAEHKTKEFFNGSDVVKVHNGMDFITKHVGPTPVS